ncbi:uncharacterized protein LOC143301534 [Babylonia areolata]|uniref:uncharacterized protein LOC143301534 n=1 Tax=Babylonia areolata TaxID=304850 RepID=UPI003FD6B41D
MSRWYGEIPLRLQHIVSKLSHQPSFPSSHSGPLINSRPADTRALHKTAVFARRTRHISFPRCVNSLRGRCRRMRIGVCFRMCLNNVIRWVCRRNNDARGRAVCHIRPVG